jgi:hypothetical protein
VKTCRQRLPNAVFTRPKNLNLLVKAKIFHLHQKSQLLLCGIFFTGNNVCHIKELDVSHSFSKLRCGKQFVESGILLLSHIIPINKAAYWILSNFFIDEPYDLYFFKIKSSIGLNDEAHATNSIFYKLSDMV